MKNNYIIRSYIYACHDRWAVVMYANLWPDWIIYIKTRAKRIFTRFESWAHKLPVKWVPVLLHPVYHAYQTWSHRSRIYHMSNNGEGNLSHPGIMFHKRIVKWWSHYIGLLYIPLSLWYKMHQIPTLKGLPDCLAPVFAKSLEARCEVENEDVVGAAPTGDAPTTSEWSTISLPTKVHLILEFYGNPWTPGCIVSVSQYCGCWYSGAITAGCQHPQNWLIAYSTRPLCSKTCHATVLIHSIFAWEKLHKRFSVSAVFQVQNRTN